MIIKQVEVRYLQKIDTDKKEFGLEMLGKSYAKKYHDNVKVEEQI